MKNYNKDYQPSWDCWALAVKNDAKEDCVVKECYDEAVNVLDNLITQKTPVIVGVDYKNGGGNFDNITDHWVVVVGKGSDEKGVYYTYYEVAKSNSKEGSSLDKNRFYFNTNGLLEAISPTVNSTKNTPIITVLRVNPENKCCSREYYNSKKEYENCIKKSHINSPKGNLIKIR